MQENRKELKVARSLVHDATELCQDLDTLDLVHKLLVYDTAPQHTTRKGSGGGAIATPLFGGIRMVAR